MFERFKKPKVRADKTINIPTSWSEISLETMDKIAEISNNSIYTDEQRETELIMLLTGLTSEEIDNMNIVSYQKILGSLKFLNQPISKVLPKDSITLNNKTYDVLLYPSRMTAAQFLDYKTIMGTDMTHKTARLIACFVVPKGAQYADDSYNPDDVVNDIYKHMNIEYAYGLTFFFESQYRAFATGILAYSIREIKKDKELPQEMKNQVLKKLQEVKAIMKDGGSTE
jgi:hypothetical protein